VVDVFYVKDVFGLKVAQSSKLRQIQRQLIASLAQTGAAPSASPRPRARTAALGS
jgi:[protein-PII] uridylyltransferase